MAAMSSKTYFIVTNWKTTLLSVSLINWAFRLNNYGIWYKKYFSINDKFSVNKVKQAFKNGFWLVYNIKRLYLWGLRESMIKELSETMYINEREDS